MEYARVGDLIPASGDTAYASDTSIPTRTVLHVAHWQGYNTLVIDTFINATPHSSMTFYGVSLNDNLNSFVPGKWHK